MPDHQQGYTASKYTMRAKIGPGVYRPYTDWSIPDVAVRQTHKLIELAITIVINTASSITTIHLTHHIPP